jgi:hypothetical protein
MMELGDIHLIMQAMFVAWITLTVMIVRRTIARGSVGLPASFVLTMTVFYGGCFVYAVPGYTHLRSGGHWYLAQHAFSETDVMRGTFLSLLGLFGFALGSGIFFPKLRGAATTGPRTRFVLPPVHYQKAVLRLLGGIAAASYAMHFLRISFPMSDALVELGRNLAVVVVCLGAFLAVQQKQPTLRWILIASLIPLYYFFIQGFVSFGFIFSALLVAFWMAQMQSPTTAANLSMRVLIVVMVVYGTLTCFVAWMSFRDQVRLIVWQGVEGSILDLLVSAITQTQLFSLGNFDSLDLINIRLNQNIFIGRMIEQHAMFPELQEWGATLVILPLVLLPRLLWQSKPIRGGNDLMEQHTGMHFSETSTFGTGQVFEFYINFGYVGVLLGFVVVGLILTRIDRLAQQHLNAGDYLAFARLFVVGIVAIDPLLQPFFIVNGAVLAWLMMTALKMTLDRWLHIKRNRRRGSRNTPPQGELN